MSNAKARRFYKAAAVTAHEAGYAVALDGRPVRTPAGRLLSLASAPLAEAIAEEWNTQTEDVRPASMPMMQLAATAVDRVDDQRTAIVAELLRFAGTDLVCYWADAPADLVCRQQDAWGPLLEWANDALGARMCRTAGILPVDQPPDALDALRRAVEEGDAFELTALQVATAAMGSLLLGLALVRGRLDADAAFAAAHLDEVFQTERWGSDREAEERRARIQAEIADAARFLALHRA